MRRTALAALELVALALAAFAPPAGAAHMWVEVTIRGTGPDARTRVALPGAAAAIRGDGTVYVETRRADPPFLAVVEGAGGTYEVTAGFLPGG